MSKKWWFSDYDGTILLDSSEGIYKQDLDFINKWIRNNNNFVIASGRNRDDLKNILKTNNLIYNYLITNNGAMVHDKNDKVILHKTISLEVRKDILKLINKWKDKVGIQLLFGNESLTVSCIKNKRKDVEPNQMVELHWLKVNNLSLNFESKVLNDKNLDTIKFYSYLEDLDCIEKDFAIIKNTRYMQTYYFVLELTNKEASKLDGIKEIQKIFNIKENDIYVSGDGENDIEMLEAFQNSFVVSSGNKKALKAGKHVIDSISDIKKYVEE
ncbi:Cof-type HAD-IIB family hydrolase [Spiroplasma gladiatoris]|uniref:Cof-type HAD-IIB family hydrolase n=1 Tax=Spiroplasma gladiatoris TaxID=2143 RepID=A0A4P7AGJ6_9MOLU|nr:HAD-IIB family hydrolase [Spiroplasma gladiatoris]QBQ07242.1 Cof-type HAD-IIB family hydrolase [Spiroplasma gladiatoris]